jgi:outer membrane protein insertion porin family
MAQTLLKKGDKYNLDVIKSERVRIDARLKEEGFFYFAPEQLIIQYDSTMPVKHQVDMIVKIKPELPSGPRNLHHKEHLCLSKLFIKGYIT